MKEILEVQGGFVIRHKDMRRRFCRFVPDRETAELYLTFTLPVCGRTSDWDVRNTGCCRDCIQAARNREPHHFRGRSRWGSRKVFSGRLRFGPGLPECESFDSPNLKHLGGKK